MFPITNDERYAKLREGLLHKYTLPELVNEIMKRDGVDYSECLSPEKYWITQSEDGETYDPIRGVGPVTILVVKE